MQIKVVTTRQSELILQEVKKVDGVDVNIKLESLGGSRRRISGGLLIEVCGEGGEMYLFFVCVCLHV